MNPNNNPYFSSAQPVQTGAKTYPSPYIVDAQRGYVPPTIQHNALNQNITFHSAPPKDLNFAPSAHEVLPHSYNTIPTQATYATAIPVSNVQPSYPYNAYSNNQGGYVQNTGSYTGQNVVYQSAPYNNPNPYSHGFSLNENVVSSHPPQGGNNYPVKMPPRVEKDMSYQRKKPHEYFGKRIENDLIKRTACVGDLNNGTEDFDDYFETHIEKFFTPELHQFIFYHDQRHIYGVQMEYRDPWGKMDKETYKGNLHMSKRVSPKSCTYSNFKLEFDEYLTELYVDGKEEITYFKFVTNEGRVFELGMCDPYKELKNFVQPLTRIMGIGGTLDLYLNSVYFYYQ